MFVRYNLNVTDNVILPMKTIIFMSAHFSSLAPARSAYKALDGRFGVLKFIVILNKKNMKLGLFFSAGIVTEIF